MKTLATALVTATVLTAAISASGQTLNAAVLLGVVFAAGIAALFVADYSRTAARPASRATAPARRTRRTPVHPEFASVIVFNTTAA